MKNEERKRDTLYMKKFLPQPRGRTHKAQGRRGELEKKQNKKESFFVGIAKKFNEGFPQRKRCFLFYATKLLISLGIPDKKKKRTFDLRV